MARAAARLIVAAALCGAAAPASAQSLGDILRGLAGGGGDALPPPRPPSGGGSGGGGGNGGWVEPGSQRPAAPRPAFDRGLVAETQQLLNDLGYDAGPVDGAMGRRTRSAIRAFETDQSLAPTGAPSPELLARLRETTQAGGGFAAAQGPGQPEASFECAQALSEAERAICASHRLAGLDRALAEAYEGAKATVPEGPAAVESRQSAWLGEREACGRDAACLERTLSDRLTALGGDPAATLAAADAVISDAPPARLSPRTIYGFLLDQYLAAHPADTETEGFLAGYAGYLCATDEGLRRASQQAASDEFARRDFVDRIRARLARDVAAAIPRSGRYTVRLRVALDQYDFENSAFPFIRGGGGALIGPPRGGCFRNAFGAARNYPEGFLLVDAAGQPLGGQAVAAMLGGSLPMPRQEARAFAQEVDRSNMTFEATVEIAAPARIAGQSYQGRSAVPAKVVSVALLGKRGRNAPEETFRRYGGDEIANPEERRITASDAPRVNYEDLLVSFVKSHPEQIEQETAAIAFAYPRSSAGCPAEHQALNNARGRNQFEYGDLVAKAKRDAQARLASLPEPPSRYTLRHTVALGAYDPQRNFFTLGRSGQTGQSFSINKPRREFCGSYGALPVGFTVSVGNVGGAYVLPQDGAEAARRFLEGNDLQQNARVTLEFVVEQTGWSRDRRGQNVARARAIEGRLIHGDTGAEILRFDPAIFDAAPSAGPEGVAPTVDFETLLTKALRGDPARLEVPRAAAAYAYRAAPGASCPPRATELTQTERSNEFRFRELLDQAVLDAAETLGAQPAAPTRFSIRTKVTLDQYNQREQAYALKGGFVGEADQPSTVRFTLSSDRPQCFSSGVRFPRQFELRVQSGSPPNRIYLSPEAARAFLTENRLDQAGRVLLQELEFEVTSVSLPSGQSGQAGAATAQLVAARLLSADGQNELHRFEPESFAAAEGQADVSIWARSPRLSYEDLFLAHVAARPSLLQDEGVVRAHLDAAGCDWRRVVSNNEIQAQARLAEGRAALAAAAAAAPASGVYAFRLSAPVGRYDAGRQAFPFDISGVWRLPIAKSAQCRRDHGATPAKFEVVFANTKPISDVGLPMGLAEGDAFLQAIGGDRKVEIEIIAEVAAPNDAAKARARIIAARAIGGPDGAVLQEYEGFEETVAGFDAAKAEVAGLRLGTPADQAAAAVAAEVSPVRYQADFGGAAASGPAAGLRRWSLLALENGERFAVYRRAEDLGSPIVAVVRTIRIPSLIRDFSGVGGRLEGTYGPATETPRASNGRSWVWRDVTTPAECAPRVGPPQFRNETPIRSEGDLAGAVGMDPSLQERQLLRAVTQSMAGLSPNWRRSQPPAGCSPVLMANASVQGAETVIVVAFWDPAGLAEPTAAAPAAAPAAPAPDALDGVKF